MTLQDAAKTLGYVDNTAQNKAASGPKGVEKPRDYSLKEGQTITVSLGGKRASKLGTGFKSSTSSQASAGQTENAMPFLPPPPSAADVKAGMQQGKASSQGTQSLTRSSMQKQVPSAKDFGFDDGEFGEFQ